MTATYDEPGRGRRQCPTCNVYIGVSVKVCVCGSAFGSAETKQLRPVQIQRQSEAGPGRKQCAGCNQYVPIRTKTCPCGYSFASKHIGNPEPTQARVPIQTSLGPPTMYVLDEAPEDLTTTSNANTGPRTTTPRGKCPVALTGTGYREVRDWAQEVRAKCKDKLATSALQYWARSFYPIGSDEYLEVCLTLEEIDR